MGNLPHHSRSAKNKLIFSYFTHTKVLPLLHSFALNLNYRNQIFGRLWLLHMTVFRLYNQHKGIVVIRTYSHGHQLRIRLLPLKRYSQEVKIRSRKSTIRNSEKINTNAPYAHSNTVFNFFSVEISFFKRKK